MKRPQRKSLATPDEVRSVGRVRLEVASLDETVIARITTPPGWRWSVDMKPIVQTPSCQNRHLGACLTGTLHVVCDDGTEMEIKAGDAYEVPPGHDAWVVGDEPVTSIEFAAARTYGVVDENDDERIVATVLFTDIVDSTRTLERLGDAAWKDLLLEHNARIRALLDRFRGREVETTGDGFLVLFDAAARAVRCAAALAPAVADLGIAIRAGLHTGEIELAHGKARGVAVHAAARVMSLAGGNEVLVSSTTHDLSTGANLRFADRGEHELKGLSGARKVWALVREGTPQ